MKKQILVAILAAGIALALVFTLSCSEDKSSDPPPEKEIGYDNINEIVIGSDDKREDGRYATEVYQQVTGKYTAYLGKGYDVLNSPYWNGKEVKTDPIIDQDSLVANGIIWVGNESNDRTKSVFSQFLSEYMEGWSNESGEGNAGKFSASLKEDFDKDKGFTKEDVFGKSIGYIEKEYHYMREVEVGDLQKYLRKTFRDNYLMNDNVKPEALFQKYGTHVITKLFMGGRYQVTFLLDNSNNAISFDGINSLINTGVNIANKILTAVSGNEDPTMALLRQKVTKVQTSGGESVNTLTLDSARANYGKWSQSIQNRVDLTLVNAPGILPIWWLIDTAGTDPNRANLIRFKKIEHVYDSLLTANGSKILAAQNGQSKRYVKDVYMGVGKTIEEAKADLTRKAIGITRVSGHLNRGAMDFNANYVYLGYTTTTNPNEAVTDIKTTVYCCNADKGKPWTYVGNSNSGQPGGYFYDVKLWQTKTPLAQGGSLPLTNLYVQNPDFPAGPSNPKYYWPKVGTNLNYHTFAVNVSDIYLWIERNQDP